MIVFVVPEVDLIETMWIVVWMRKRKKKRRMKRSEKVRP